jgi:hypothetical protein
MQWSCTYLKVLLHWLPAGAYEKGWVWRRLKESFLHQPSLQEVVSSSWEQMPRLIGFPDPSLMLCKNLQLLGQQTLLVKSPGKFPLLLGGEVETNLFSSE